MLVLGGTRFVGPAVVEAALAEGWEVTTFNRGRSGTDLIGVRAVRGDRTSVEDLAELRHRGPWDVAVDLSGYVPRETLQVCRTLEPVVAHYVLMSTVSVYRDWPVRPLTEASAVLECPANAGPDFGEDTEDGPTRYGYQKVGCENAARLVFGTERCAVLRPGVVLGPREYVGRLPWWLRRVARGGEVLAPGAPDRTIQPVNVRDLAEFCVRIAKDRTSGTFNVTAPVGRETFGGLLGACAEVTGTRAEFVWVPDDVLLAQGVRQWSEMPLWRTFPGVWQVDAAGAYAAGFSARPLADTVRATWAWLQSDDRGFADERATEIGIDPEHERAILTSLR